jgi:hypothetical protein
MPLFVVKAQVGEERAVIHGPYDESSFENIRRSAQIASAKGKDTRELIWKCASRPPQILYIYRDGALIFPKGKPGDRNSKRGKTTFSCVTASGNACKLPPSTTKEAAVKSRRKAMNVNCPVKFTVVDTPTSPGPRKAAAVAAPKAGTAVSTAPKAAAPAPRSPCPPCPPCPGDEQGDLPRSG